MGGNPHFAPTASANAAIATVSFAEYLLVTVK
jgi:hypothetical protein